jgi:putative SOS response-associated peptidase YedK
MPVFLPPDAFDRWLDCDAVLAEEAAALIKPAEDDPLEVHPISFAVNRVTNDSEALIAPVAPDAAGVREPPPKAKPEKNKKNDDQPTLF